MTLRGKKRRNWKLHLVNIQSLYHYRVRSYKRCRMCAMSRRSFSQVGMVENDVGGKDKKFLFFISKKKRESSPSILVTRNPNWS
jgi:hypothetical protein